MKESIPLSEEMLRWYDACARMNLGHEVYEMAWPVVRDWLRNSDIQGVITYQGEPLWFEKPLDAYSLQPLLSLLATRVFGVIQDVRGYEQPIVVAELAGGWAVAHGGIYENAGAAIVALRRTWPNRSILVRKATDEEQAHWTAHRQRKV